VPATVVDPNIPHGVISGVLGSGNWSRLQGIALTRNWKRAAVLVYFITELAIRSAHRRSRHDRIDTQVITSADPIYPELLIKIR
jgi:G3E family GTPase